MLCHLVACRLQFSPGEEAAVVCSSGQAGYSNHLERRVLCHLVGRQVTALTWRGGSCGLWSIRHYTGCCCCIALAAFVFHLAFALLGLGFS